MNIFVTNPCPYESARYLDDKRVVKMVLETAQILSTVVYKYDPGFHGEHAMYRPTHENHPCVKWAAESMVNFVWLYNHLKGLAYEYNLRYDKHHKSALLLPAIEKYIESQGHTLFVTQLPNFVNCARNTTQGVDFTDVNNVYLAYQKYLASRWDADKRQPTWHGKG